MFSFDTNPFCHRYVERITNFCLEVSANDNQSKVLKKTKLIERIIAAEATAATQKHKALNIPYLHSVGRMVQHVAATNTAVKPSIEGTAGVLFLTITRCISRDFSFLFIHSSSLH